MKKILSMLAVSTLVGTSASNLKPLFTSNISQGFKSNQINKNSNIQDENDTNPFVCKINDLSVVYSIAVAPNGTTYIGTAISSNCKLYKSTDGISFKEVPGVAGTIWSIAVASNGIIWVATDVSLYKSTNDGISFSPISLPSETKIYSIAVAPNGTTYIETANASNWKLYKSTDGISFKEVLVVAGTIWSIAVASNGIIWVSIDDGLYKSTNDGISFSPIADVTYIIKIIVVSDENIWLGTKSGLYKSTDKMGTKFNKINIVDNHYTSSVDVIVVASNGTIWVAIHNSLYKSTNDGISFSPISLPSETKIYSIAVASNGTTYIGTASCTLGIYLINQFLKIDEPDTFDNSWEKYRGIVYNSTQKIDIKDKLVETATLDEKSQTLPKIGLELTNGQHTLVLNLKNKYKQYANLFGGKDGQVTYKLWVKTAIDKEKINYSTNTDDTDLTNLSLGFVSVSGNTNGCPIIQTKTKDGSGTHNSPLITTFNDSLIDYTNSYYIQGTVDETTNDFKATGSKQRVLPTIATDGAYHLHLVDTVGNTYDSYLELGENNWKLKGTFKNDELDKLKTKLSVTVNLTDPKQLAQATGWLNNYDKFASDLFEKSLQANGKGFDEEIKAAKKNDFTWFLKPLTYEPSNDTKFADGIEKDKLDKTIRDTAEKCLQDGLSKVKAFTENLNVDTSKVLNSNNLISYTKWINDYNDFITTNKDQWITNAVAIVSRGFANDTQIDKIKTYFNRLDFKNYLKRVEWNSTTGLTTNSNYQQYVELGKLQSDTIAWINQNIPEINQAYENALKTAESGLNLHGYSIDTLLNGNKLPQTKSEIDNFADVKSFHNWLQTQANIKFHGWQLTMGIGLGIPLFLGTIGIAWFVRKATDSKYNPYAWARKDKTKIKRNTKHKVKDNE